MKPLSGSVILSCLIAVFFLESCGKSPSNSPPVDSTPQTLAHTVFREPSPSSPDDLLLAEWMGGKVYLSQIDNILKGRLAQIIQGAAMDERMASILAKERQSKLYVLIENYLLIQEAHARGLQLSDTQKETILKEFLSRFDTREEYEESLKQSGQTEEELMKAYYNIHLGQMCVANERDRIAESITPEILRTYYDKHIPDRFTPPARSDINWVVIKKTEERTLDEARERAYELHKEVKAGLQGKESLEDKRKVLQDCAEQYSDDFTGTYNYGNVNLYHGVSGWENYDPAFREELSKITSPGMLSDVVKIDESSYGFFLVYNYVPTRISSFDSQLVQDMLPNLVLHEKLEEWRSELKKKYGLIIHEENLSAAPCFIYDATNTLDGLSEDRS